MKLLVVRERISPNIPLTIVHRPVLKPFGDVQSFVEGARVPAPEPETLKRFDIGLALDEPERKSFQEVKDGSRVVDVINVSIKGYLSTFESTTRSDRQGDYIVEGAFTDTIPAFMKNNPVLLRDHINMTDYIAGTFVVMRQDKTGLYIEAKLTDAPGNLDTRFKVADGTLKTLSMGGLFHYNEDGRGIFKVDLWEGSLVPIPANPDCQISVRSLNDREKRFVKSGAKSFFEFEQAEARSQNHAGVAA